MVKAAVAVDVDAGSAADAAGSAEEAAVADAVTLAETRVIPHAFFIKASCGTQT